MHRTILCLALISTLAACNGAAETQGSGSASGGGFEGGPGGTGGSGPSEPTEPGEPRSEGGGSGQAPADPIDYEGPEITAELQVAESEPPQYSVLVRAECPTLGWTLEEDRCETLEGVTRLRVRLIEPGPEQMVGQAFETQSVLVGLEQAPEGPVQVCVSRWTRGVEYLVEPEAKLAAVIEPE